MDYIVFYDNTGTYIQWDNYLFPMDSRMNCCMFVKL